MEYQDFPSKFLSHCTEIFHWRTLWRFRKILLSKIFMHRRGGRHGFVGTFCLTGPKRKALYRNPSVFRKFSGIEKHLWIRGGISRFSVEIFMSHSAENFREGILLFLRKFLVAKSFMDEKGVSRFSVESFWSHSAEKFHGHRFNVSENLRYRKLLCIIKDFTSFRQKLFVSQAEKIRGHPFNVSENLGYRKILCIIRGITSFRRKFFVSQCQKTS